MWTTATTCDRMGAATAAPTQWCLASKRPAIRKGRHTFRIRGAGRMSSDRERREPVELTGFGLILNSKAYSQSLPATMWDKLDNANQQSVEYFAVRYATPIYCYYRRKWRLHAEEAKDLTMDFIFEKLVTGNLLKNFRPGKTHFRAYLLQSLRHFLVDLYRKNNKLHLLPLDPIMEASPDAEPIIEDSADTKLIKDYTHDQLRAALLRVREECYRDGLEEHFQIFALRQFAEPRPTWEEIGQSFGLDWQQAKNRAWTVKDRLRTAILEEFQITGMTAQQIREEIQSRCKDFQGSAGQDFDIQEEDLPCSQKK
jgi:DNA-directed RNA polymerase specialized sigma24 family protein